MIKVPPSDSQLPDNKVWYLKHSKLFERTGSEVVEGYEHMFTVRSYPRRTQLFDGGSDSRIVFFIKRGHVRLSRITEDGREVAICVLGPGDLFGEEALFGETKRTTIATCMEEALVCTTRADMLLSIVAREPAISLNMAKYVKEQRDDAMSTIEDIVHLTVPQRLLRLFERLAQQYGVPAEDGICIDVPLTHSDIASLIGSTRETVAHEITKLAKAKKISFSKKRFTLPLPLPALV